MLNEVSKTPIILYPYSNYSVYFEKQIGYSDKTKKENKIFPKVMCLSFPVLKNLYSHPIIKNYV